MTEEETQSTMLEVANLASNAAYVAISGCCPDFDHDAESVETLLAEALLKSIEEIDGPADAGNDARRALVAPLREFLGQTS